MANQKSSITMGFSLSLLLGSIVGLYGAFSSLHLDVSCTPSRSASLTPRATPEQRFLQNFVETLIAFLVFSVAVRGSLTCGRELANNYSRTVKCIVAFALGAPIITACAIAGQFFSAPACKTIADCIGSFLYWGILLSVIGVTIGIWGVVVLAITFMAGVRQIVKVVKPKEVKCAVKGNPMHISSGTKELEATGLPELSPPPSPKSVIAFRSAHLGEGQ